MFNNSKYILFILFSAINIFSCRKNNESAPQNITGTWKLLKTYCDCPTPPVFADSIGLVDIIRFSTNKTWNRAQNNVTVDSGIYSTGYGSYTNYAGGFTFKYDSVSYFRNGNNVGSDFYEILSNDTLVFGAGIAGRFSSYSLPYNGSMWFIKQ
ncbi:MAG TPA: hypothetical protein VK711_11695 [Puia sp.]|jgi:hypothetical protein|nr:hypothetical protein [Puia sp.]